MNLEKIKNKIKEKGLKYKFIAEKLNITENSFSRKISGKSIFTIVEIKEMGLLLELDQKELVEFFLS